MTQRRVLITGAGSGLGRALAERYARSGARVACVDMNGERAEATRQSLAGSGHTAHTANVASDADIDRLRDDVQREWGGLDVLINNAGIATGGPMVDTTMDEWHKVIDINLLGVVRGCRAFLPGMIAAGKGQIVSTASFAGLAGAPNIMSYGVTKAGVVALSEGLRAEMHGKGIRVSVICPSFFKTNLIESFIGDSRTRGFAEKMLNTSRDTLDAVADKVFADAEAGVFLILPTKHEPMRWRLKRWFPDFYFRKLIEAVAKASR